MMSVAENLRNIQEAIEKASKMRRKVSIVGVTKHQPLHRIEEAVEAGLTIFANNYVQEGQQVRTAISKVPVSWHFIGHIQSRKVKFLTDYQCIQSLDRASIAADLDEELGKTDRAIEILVEVNIGAEPQKSGVAPSELTAFLKEVYALKRLKLRGLMCMPPPLQPVEQRRPFFREMKALFDQFSMEYPFHTLSMGTSDDFLIAVKEGSNMVRLGTKLFGERKG